MYVLFGAKGTTKGNVNEGIFIGKNGVFVFVFFRIWVVCACMQRNKITEERELKKLMMWTLSLLTTITNGSRLYGAPNEFLIIHHA